MIVTGTTTIVNFFVADSDGLPATNKSGSISAKISIDGGAAAAITDSIAEIDSTEQPGWYRFSHTFATAGNAFIMFTCSGCKIMPWEEQVVEISTSPAPSASDIATAVWGANVRSLSTLSVTSGGISFDIATSNGVNQAIRVIKDYGDTKWLTASGFATPSDIPTSDISAIKTKTDNLPASPAAVGSAMTLTLAYDAAKTASQLTVADLPSDYAKPGDAMTLTATYNAAKTAAQAGDAMTLTAAYNAAKTASQFNAATDTVTINATQAAGMATATGFATPSDIPTSTIDAIKTKVDSLNNTDLTGIATTANVTAAQTAIINAMPSIPSDYAKSTDIPDISNLATSTDVTNAQVAIIDHGDDNWTGGGSGGGATPKQIWEYPTRTITDSPTDISSLATKTDLSNSQSAVISAMPSVSGLATGTDVTNAKSDIIAAIPAIPQDYAKTTDIPDISGLATSTNVSTAQAAIIAAIPAIPTDYAKTTDIPDISGLSTFNPAQDTVQLDATQLASLATGSEVTDAKDDIITAISDIDIDTSDLAKATDVAVVADMLKQVDAGVLHWSTTATVLTLYKEDNTVLRQYSLQRDIQGNITRIDPING